MTILWRATAETKNVFVFRVGEVNKPMVRLLDTDLWYKTFQFQKGARFIYQLATNLPDPKEWGGIIRFAGALQNDPLNPLSVRRASQRVQSVRSKYLFRSRTAFRRVTGLDRRPA